MPTALAAPQEQPASAPVGPSHSTSVS